MDNHSYSTGLPGNPAVQNGHSDNVPFPAISETMVGGNFIKTVDGRDVHRFLKVGKDYTTWMKDRIKKYGFIEGVDFVIVEDLSSPKSGSAKARAQTVTEYFLTLSMGKELGMVDRSEQGRRIRKYFISIEEQATAPRQMTPAEMFLHSAQTMYAIEQRQAAQAVAIQTIGTDIENLKQSLTVLDKLPPNGELITHLRKRVAKVFGLSFDTINKVMDAPTYALHPKFAVRNHHENAKESANAGYWKKDVNAVFKRFVSECVQVTPTMCTHPYIEGRFRLVKEAE